MIRHARATSVCNAGENSAGNNAWIRKFNAEGSPIWTRSYDGGDNDFANSIAVGANDEVAVTGRSTLFGSPAIWLRLYDSDGVEQWTETHESGFPTSADSGNGVAIDSAGNVVVVGQVQTGDPDVTQAWVRKYSPNGGDLWAAQWNIVEPTGEAETAARGVAIDGEDNVVVVGFEEDAAGAYSAWVRKLTP